MKELKKYIFIVGLSVSLFACKKPIKDIPHYVVSKVIKTDTATTLNVHIKNRMTEQQLLLIAGKIKADSVKIQNLLIHYLLPGNPEFSSGDNSYYASAKYIKESDVKPSDTSKDDNDNVFRVKIYGINKDQAWHLLTMQPNEIAGKKVMGRFIDDYNHTVIIPFTDPADKKNEVYVIELDSTSKVVSAVVPLKKMDEGVEKWLVTQNGDYMILKDSVLAQFAVDGLGLPFNSIKSGI